MSLKFVMNQIHTVKSSWYHFTFYLVFNFLFHNSDFFLNDNIFLFNLFDQLLFCIYYMLSM